MGYLIANSNTGSVQSSGSVTSSTGLSFTFPNAVSTGDMIVVGVEVNGTSASTSTVTVSDSAGNTYHQAGGYQSFDSTSNRMSIWYAFNVTGGSSFKVTVKPSITAFVSLTLMEVSGGGTTDPYGGSQVGAQGNSTAPSAGTLTTTAGDLCFCVSANDGSGGQTYSAGTGWTAPAGMIQNGQTNEPVAGEYILSATGTTQAAGFTLSGSATQWGCIAANFHPGAGGGGSFTWQQLTEMPEIARPLSEAVPY